MKIRKSSRPASNRPITCIVALLCSLIINGCDQTIPGTEKEALSSSTESTPNRRAGEIGSEMEEMGPPVRMISWNVESDGADPKVIAQRLADFSDASVIALSEVGSRDFSTYLAAVNAAGKGTFVSVDSKSGDEDRLQLIINTDDFQILAKDEPMRLLDRPVNEGRHRSPLIVTLKHLKTGVEFRVVGVHLARGNADFRNQQSVALREWARNDGGPIVMIGDWNYDFVFETEKGNQAFEELQKDNVLQWVRPAELVDSNWYDEQKDGFDDYPGSLLDGAYVAGSARTWNPRLEVIVIEGDFPDDETTSDHRPIRLELDL